MWPWPLSFRSLNSRMEVLPWTNIAYQLILEPVWSKVFMAAHRAGHLHFAAVVSILFFFLSFFPRLFSAVADWMSTILLWCGLSANLECRSEMCCTRLWKYRTQKNRYLRAIAQLCRAISLQLRHVSTIRKKASKQQYHVLAIWRGPLTAAEIGWWVWSTAANLNGFCILASLVHWRPSTEVNQTLHDVRPSPGLLHYAFLGALACYNGILPGAMFTLRPCVLLYIGSIATRHSSSVRQPNFAAWHKEGN